MLSGVKAARWCEDSHLDRCGRVPL